MPLLKFNITNGIVVPDTLEFLRPEGLFIPPARAEGPGRGVPPRSQA